MIKFLRGKMAGDSLLYLFRLEVESLLFGLFSIIPTSFGIFIRAMLCKMLLLKSTGCQLVMPRVIFVHASRIKMGRNVGINSNVYINGIGGVDIGDYVLIGNNVTISSGKHAINGNSPEIYKRRSIPLKIVIGNDVWIGSGAVIMPGITLGQGSVVGANAVVLKDTEPYSINVGVPSRIVGYRE